MNDVQTKSINLLKEIHDICIENDLNYSLGPKSIVAFLNDMETINYDIVMSASDMLKLIEIVNAVKKKDRALDYIKVNKNYIGYEVSYVDTSSTCINLARGWDFKELGIKIIIKPIRYHTKGVKDKIAGILETGWNCNGYRLTRKKSKKIFSMGLVRALMIFGKKNVGKFIFNRITNASLSGNESYFKEKKKSRKKLSHCYFEDMNKMVYDDVSFHVFSKYEDFLSDVYGYNWEVKVAGILNYKNFLIVPNTAYKDFLESLQSRNLNLKDFFKNQRKNLFRSVFISKYLKLRKKALLIARRSGDRLHFYEEFEKRRNEIMELYNQKDFNALSEIFVEHEKKTLYYLKNGLGFCVNKEFFAIQCDLFRYQGNEKVISKLVSLIPDEHYQSII